MRFAIEVDAEWVEIRWFEPLGSRFSPAYRELVEELESVDGVESANTNRYSANVQVAGHAANPLDVALDIGAVLQARFPHATIEWL